jgi:hypothetical protein
MKGKRKVKRRVKRLSVMSCRLIYSFLKPFKGTYMVGRDCWDESMMAARLQNGIRKDGLYNAACDCDGYQLKKDGFPDNFTSSSLYKPTCDQIRHII